ncbi:MAG: hypothetical protein JSV98_08780 [candidate division WOR-3 bacterium]|nr:MAG: hypothetical protein JSV98_08780 [candidate division WOR-3 bacterium]
MSDIKVIRKKARSYARRQNYVDSIAAVILVCALALIALSMALLLLRSPWYCLLGLVPLFFLRPKTLMARARELEKKAGLKGEIVSSIQLSKIPADSKEKYSQELIAGFISSAAARVLDLDVRKYISYRLLNRSVEFLLIAVVLGLIQPAFFSGRFWYALNHRIDHQVWPGNREYPKDAEAVVKLHLSGVYVPKSVDLLISTAEKADRRQLKVDNGIATANVNVSDPVVYRFEFFEHRTVPYELYPIEPIFIENLTFTLEYPAYTKLLEETRTGRQLIVPYGTVVRVAGKASQKLKDARFEYVDTVSLEYEGSEFRGTFIVTESSNAVLHLAGRSELQEPIRIYAIPDLAPLVDIFYPGFDVNLPYDMKLDVGVRCSDDYGLAEGVFYYSFREEHSRPLPLRRGAYEDTTVFNWDLSELAMLPGDEISYYVMVRDNSGHVTRSNTYTVHFPTMEQMYEEVNEKETLLQIDIADMQTEHAEQMREAARIQEKIMKERDFSWGEQEQLSETIRKEEEILTKISEWQDELEKTVEKLKEGVILDQESIERLREISRILEEMAPEELRKALEDLRLAMEQRPADLPRALEQLKQRQDELAKALERTLEILRRYEQEEKLRQIAEQVEQLAEQQEFAEDLSATDENLALEKQQEIDQAMEELAEMMKELAQSEGLEQDIKDALEQMAQQMQEMQNASSSDKKSGLKNLAMGLQQLYQKLTQGRFVNLRKNLLESLQQIIETSKAQENLIAEIDKGSKIDSRMQQEIIQATETIAESLFQQQSKSFLVGPQIGKGLARATLRMQEAQRTNVQGAARKALSAEAMKELNLVARDILFALKTMMEDGSSTGMNSFMQQLANITQGQMMLGQSLMNILPIPMQGLSQAQKAQLRRLAQRQRELKEALQSLKGDAAAGKYQDMLDNMIGEMEEIEQDLFRYKLDRELIERQRKVISRLLDSQRSIRKEDFSQRRESKPGQDVLERTRPAVLSRELGIDELRRLLQEELRKPYPKEYEMYIREYFKALLGEK